MLLSVHADGHSRRQRAAEPVSETPARPASRPIPGAGGSPARRRRARRGRRTRPRRPATQVAAFFGTAAAVATSTSRRRAVDWTGRPATGAFGAWCCTTRISARAAGGVDAFLIGSELRGLTHVRDRRGDLSGVAALVDARGGRAGDPRGRHEDQLRRRLVGVFRAPAGGRLGRRVLPPRSALGRRRRSISSASTTTCRCRTGATGSTISTRAGGDVDLRPRLSARRTSRAARASTGTMPAPPTATAQVRTPITDGAARQAVGLPLQGYRGLVVEPAPQPAGRGRERRRRRRGSPESKPIWLHRDRLPGGRQGRRTSRTSSSTRSRPRASCRISRAAGATTRCSARFLEAVLGYWADAGATTRSRRLWRADDRHGARPRSGPGTRGRIPAFPARSDVWADADNWRLGHWLNGRLGSVSLGSLVRELCRRAGLPDEPDRRLGARRRRRTAI